MKTLLFAVLVCCAVNAHAQTLRGRADAAAVRRREYARQQHLHRAGGRRQLCVSVAWSGQALQAAARRSTLKFLVPEEGELLTVDSWAIPKSAKQPELAYRFTDYMLDARNAWLSSEAAHFYAPLRSDLPEMIELAKQPAELVPPPGERRRLYFLTPQTQVINQQWQALRQQYQQQQRP